MRCPAVALALSFVCVVSLASMSAQGGAGCTATPNVEPVGSGTTGAFGTPVLEGLGTPISGSPGSFRFRVRGAAPFAPGVLLLARHEQPDHSATFQATTWTGPFYVPVLFQCDANGEAVISPGRTTAALDLLCGLDLISQASLLDFTGPGGATWTNGLRFRFGASTGGG